MSTDPRLQRLLGGDALATLRRRLRRHFERADPDAPATSLRLGDLDAAEREALALLSGRAPRDARSMQLDLPELDARLRAAGIAASLREALERLDGPIVHLATARAAEQARWVAAAAQCPHPALAAWTAQPGALGLVKRLSRQDSAAASRLLSQAAAVLARLPAAGLPRAQLAAEVLGNAHALDGGQPAATIVLAVLRQAGPPTVEDASGDSARDTWAQAGVLVNELARPALYLNLPTCKALSALPGEPGYLSLHQLLRSPPAWDVAGCDVFVCENPNLLAIAADRLGPRCAPLVCTDGMPAAAQRTLLHQLQRAGARLRYHGDFDWPGLRIGNHVMKTWQAAPWRFGTDDYATAVAAAPRTQRDLPLDDGVQAAWDPALAPLMRRHGLVIAEEAVAAGLVEDLWGG